MCRVRLQVGALIEFTRQQTRTSIHLNISGSCRIVTENSQQQATMKPGDMPTSCSSAEAKGPAAAAAAAIAAARRSGAEPLEAGS